MPWRSAGRFARALLHKRVPRAAVAAASLPLRRLGAAFLADEHGFGSLHVTCGLQRTASQTTDHLIVGQQISRNSFFLNHLYVRCTRAPRRHNTSYGMVPMAAAISRASSDCHVSPPCEPRNTT